MIERMSVSQYKTHVATFGAKSKVNKFSNIHTWRCAGCNGLKVDKPKKIDPCQYCGINKYLYFPSKLQARHWDRLLQLQRVGIITKVEHEVRFPLDVNGIHIGDYVADLVCYEKETGKRRVIDTKGGEATQTKDFKIKQRLMLAVHGIEIEIVTK